MDMLSLLKKPIAIYVCSHSLDTKFVPLGSSLKSNPNPSFGEAVKITHTFTMGKWFDHIIYLTLNLWWTHMAAFQYNVQNCSEHQHSYYICCRLLPMSEICSYIVMVVYSYVLFNWNHYCMVWLPDALQQCKAKIQKFLTRSLGRRAVDSCYCWLHLLCNYRCKSVPIKVSI